MRIAKLSFFSSINRIAKSIGNVQKLSIVITDILKFSEEDFGEYENCLSILEQNICDLYLQGHNVYVNIITDRMHLSEMHNCDAGCRHITLAPNGKFYICPAFYQDNCETPISDGFNIGSLEEGVNIKNKVLYDLNHAPICKGCDAYHCKRCVWLNYKSTNEVNTPGHEQCVLSHLERNKTRELLEAIREANPDFQTNIKINEINYLDPFDIRRV